METGWDKALAQKLRTLKFSQEQIGVILGEVAEQRQASDRQGYVRGYNLGYEEGFNKCLRITRKKPDDL